MILTADAILSFFFQAEDGIRDKLVTGVQTCVFLQAEDGIRDKLVTGVQTCALPISLYHRLYRIWLEDAVAAPLYQQIDLYGVNKRLVWHARSDELLRAYDMALNP